MQSTGTLSTSVLKKAIDRYYKELHEYQGRADYELATKTATCRTWRVCQRLRLRSPILIPHLDLNLPPRTGQVIRGDAPQRAVQVSHLPVGIRLGQPRRIEELPIVRSQDPFNWRRLVGQSRQFKRCNAQHAVR